MDFSYCLSTLLNKVLFLFLLYQFLSHRLLHSGRTLLLATRHEVPEQNQEEVQDLGIGFADKVSAVVFAMMFASVPFLVEVGGVSIFKKIGQHDTGRM